MSHPSPVPTERKKLDTEQLMRLAPRLISLVSGQGRHIIIGAAALLGASGINLLFPVLVRNYLNTDLRDELSSHLFTEILIVLASLFVIQGVLFYLRHLHLQIVGLKIVRTLRHNLFSTYLSHPTSFFDQNRSGDILSRIFNDCEQVQRGLSINISVVLRYSIQIIGGVGIMLYISPMLTATILLVLPILASISLYFSKRLKAQSQQVQESLASSSTAAEEALSGIRVVKLFGAELRESDKFLSFVRDHELASIERTKIAACFSSAMTSILNIAIAFIFTLGFYWVSQSKLSVGDITAFMLYGAIVAVSFGFLLNAWAEFVQSLGAAERIYEILDSKIIEPIQNTHEVSPQTKEAMGPHLQIELKDIYFSYTGRERTLENISFTIPASKTTAIVGPSGAGKSTLAFLIPRLYTQNSGTVLFNNIDSATIPLEELRKFISFVPQNPQLFSGSIRENILYGKPSASQSEVEKVVEKAALSHFISQLPEGIDTLIGDKGVQLSGGEKQRVSIARALIADPKLLILDEATSSLDSKNELLVQQALEAATQGRTTVIIAHRLSTIKNADQVIVLDGGKVLQQGKHETLLSQEGLYSELVQGQFIGNS